MPDANTPDLTDPLTEPNPLIRELLEIGYKAMALSMDCSFPEARLEYAEANRHILRAVEALYKVKNILSGDQDL